VQRSRATCSARAGPDPPHQCRAGLPTCRHACTRAHVQGLHCSPCASCPHLAGRAAWLRTHPPTRRRRSAPWQGAPPAGWLAPPSQLTALALDADTASFIDGLLLDEAGASSFLDPLVGDLAISGEALLASAAPQPAPGGGASTSGAAPPPLAAPAVPGTQPHPRRPRNTQRKPAAAVAAPVAGDALAAAPQWPWQPALPPLKEAEGQDACDDQDA